MCGRFILISSSKHLAEEFGLVETSEARRSYIMAPLQEISVIGFSPDGFGGLQLTHLKWGMVPSGPYSRISRVFINASSETIGSKPTIKRSFKSRRALIPTNGVYEWAKFNRKTNNRILFI